MLSPLRNRFGIPGVIAVIALVFAMLGGAYAATNDGGGKATASKGKAKRGPRGPKGATGPAGPVGSQGPAGANGKDGSNGTNGSNGNDGQSVTGTPIAAGGECGPGVTGVKYTLGATSTKVCNGEDGDPGESPVAFPFTKADEEAGEPAGEPCDLAGGVLFEVGSSESIVCNGKEGSSGGGGSTLAPGASETGVFAQQTSVESGAFGIFAPISFPIPLDEETQKSVNFEDPVDETHPHIEFVEAEAEEEHCPGTYLSPQATPGYLCVYENGGLPPYNTTFVNAKLGPAAAGVGVLSSGTYLEFTANEADELAVAAGSFAITGCSATLPSGDPNKCP